MTTGDEHHTMEELYDYRMAYHAFAVRYFSADLGIISYKSRYHQDGTVPFGDDKWFIVVTEVPIVGQVSNHYPMKYWDYFDAKPICCSKCAYEQLPVYDGHTPEIALERLMRYLRDY